jgi:hypothetical protein
MAVGTTSAALSPRAKRTHIPIGDGIRINLKEENRMAKLEIVKSSLKKTIKKHKEKFQSFLDGWYGWEKWLQVELAFELSKCGEVYVESRYAYNQNKKLPIGKLKNKNAFIDLIFRKHNDSKGYYSAIELTVGRTQRELRKVLLDLMKIRAVKNSKWEFRSVFVVLVYDVKVDKNTKFVNLCRDIQEEFNAETIVVEDFTFLMFGWESNNSIANMCNSGYSDRVEGLVELDKSQEVYPKMATKKSSDRTLRSGNV